MAPSVHDSPRSASAARLSKSPPPASPAAARQRTASPPPAVRSTPAPEDDDKKEASTPQPPAAEEESEEIDVNDTGDVIDMEVLEQILELDEGDEEMDFSKGMVLAYFEQASSTFDNMDAAFAEKNLNELSSLGHFLKGSSAALGVVKVQKECEHIQHYGHLRDEEHDKDLSNEDALKLITEALKRVKREHARAERSLRAYFGSLGVTLPLSL